MFDKLQLKSIRFPLCNKNFRGIQRIRTSLSLLLALVSLLACSREAPETATQLDDSDEILLQDSQQSPQSPNSLTPSEKTTGWKPLFDGVSTEGWHSYLKNTLEGWQVKEGVLFTPGKQGDIVTDQEYENFELELEWKIEDQGNSGVFYYVVENPAYQRIHETGPEFQIIDDQNYPQELADNQKTGSNSDVKAPSHSASLPPGSWNHTRIKADNGKVEHWLNEKLILEFDMNSPEWKELVAKSKFAAFDYAKVRKGHIALQDHGGPVSFRNIKIREL
jgi:hypothetical protein